MLILFFNVVSAQVTTFERIYPAPWDQSSRDIVETPDGGYLLAGFTETTIVDDMDMYIVKTDNNGDTLWTKHYGGPEPEYSYLMLSLPNEQYFVIGYSQSFGNGDYNTYLIKINSDGDTLWTRNYGGWGNEDGREIVATADGNYVFTGTSNSQNFSNYDIYLTKIDPDGNVIWTKYYGGSDKETSSGLKSCLDGGFIIAGQTYSYGAGDADAYLIRTDANGDTLWTRTYGGTLADEAKSILQNPDGTFTVAIRDSSYGAGDIDVRISKLDSAGNILWSKIYGGTDKDTPKRIYPTNDNGYIVACTSRSFGWTDPNMWILKLDALGDTLWVRYYGAFDHEHCEMAKQASDGGYIAVGHSRSYSPNREFEIMFLKLNEMGTLGMVSSSHYGALNEISVSPNPSEGSFKINFEKNTGTYHISVLNVYGQVVYSQTGDMMKKIQNIDLSKESPGFYFLNITSQENNSDKIAVTHKLILK